MNLVKVDKDDYVVTEGERGTDLFFVLGGVVDCEYVFYAVWFVYTCRWLIDLFLWLQVRDGRREEAYTDEVLARALLRGRRDVHPGEEHRQL